MEKLVQQPDNGFLAALQSVPGIIETLFQAAELFPVRIQIFSPEGTTVFANRAIANKRMGL